MSQAIREHPVNGNVAIRQCDSPERGLGLFATLRLSKGLKILSEQPLLVDETRQDMINDVAYEFHALPLASQALFTRLYAGPLDLVPIMTGENEREQRARLSVATARLQQIVHLNSVEGAGADAFIPNAYAYYNYETGSVALHALRDIQPNEEVTNFACRCNRCSPETEAHAASETRRERMKEIRDEITRHYQAESPSDDDTLNVITKLRELIQLIEEEEAVGLELSLRIGELGRLQGATGDSVGARMTERRAMVVRRLCVGADHPS
ncbi:uncharacterized protein PG986_013722 [Apiospora aurea]|uniref:SET domain-containing protein n=1 Tax=Apiospora aurea TaxID=335848 RepID=A0ABR1PWE5_9PEZI